MPKMVMLTKSKTKGKLSKTGNWSKEPSIELGSRSSIQITDITDYQINKIDLGSSTLEGSQNTVDSKIEKSQPIIVIDNSQIEEKEYKAPKYK